LSHECFVLRLEKCYFHLREKHVEDIGTLENGNNKGIRNHFRGLNKDERMMSSYIVKRYR
jgi:hypothetical protein